ncbi:hypothetical protein J6590_003142 [Homalodisca vitripennis]|nr:hypothetical protein J6590_003142 [Homalodisca vitripennis]
MGTSGAASVTIKDEDQLVFVLASRLLQSTSTSRKLGRIDGPSAEPRLSIRPVRMFITAGISALDVTLTPQTQGAERQATPPAFRVVTLGFQAFCPLGKSGLNEP